MIESNTFDATLIGVLIDTLTGMRATPGLHDVKNVKDLMMLIRPDWVDLEQTIGSRKPTNLRTIAEKMIRTGARLAICGYKLRRMQEDEDQRVRESTKKPGDSKTGEGVVSRR